jgi:hypothetical protein
MGGLIAKKQTLPGNLINSSKLTKDSKVADEGLDGPAVNALRRAIAEVKQC